jgi:mannose-1-phosphate guanylyltransferase/mannose-6-phosphate isomerase
LSRERYPKQFLALNGSESLLKQAARRALEHCDDVIVATNEEQYFYVRDELKGLVPEENIVKEPCRRNTAPAIALAALYIKENHSSESFLTMPSDHILGEDFFAVADEAMGLSKRRLVAFGVKPSFAAPGYGYIKPGKALEHGFEIERFIEKPAKEKAEKLLSEACLWNSGIFLFNPELLMEELKACAPEIARYMHSFSELLENYSNLPSISIDYAVMEKSSRAAVVAYSGEWRDIGSWQSVYEIAEKDSRGNAVKGDAITLDTSSCLLYGGERLIATIGVKNLAIVDTRDALLVADASQSERVREISKTLKSRGREEAVVHKTVHKPWGYYTTLEEGKRYKVKRLCIYPGRSISLQMHHHRAEHWIVVKGTAKVTRGEEVRYVHENGEREHLRAQNSEAPPREPWQSWLTVDRNPDRRVLRGGRHHTLRGRLW